MSLRPVLLSLFVTSLVACSIANNEGPSNGAGATSSEIDQCKTSCDDMKFFDCSTSSEQAACYNDCKAASSEQIRLFHACAHPAVKCDASCRTTIAPAPGTPETSTSPTSPAPSSAGSTSDSTAKVVVIPPPTSSGANNADASKEKFEISVCESACNQIHAESCITAKELTSCRAACDSVKAETRNHLCGVRVHGQEQL